jgi:hypothetical protein
MKICILAQVMLTIFLTTSHAQLVPGPFECGQEGKNMCNKFIENGGLTCKRNTQIICYHKNQNDNDKDYCNSEATYNCRTFLSKYGFICDTTTCIMSHLY